jgi:hypothetical protein
MIMFGKKTKTYLPTVEETREQYKRTQNAKYAQYKVALDNIKDYTI